MLLEIFGLFVGMSFILITLGLLIPVHSEMALVGFFFLFLLSFVVMGNNLQYENGYEEVYIYGNNFSGYHWDYNEPLEPRPQDETMAYLFHRNRTALYTTYTGDVGVFDTHIFGYFMAILSGFGFAGVLFGLRRTNNYND